MPILLNKIFLQKAPVAVVRAAHDTTFNSVVAILLHSDDNSELQVHCHNQPQMDVKFLYDVSLCSSCFLQTEASIAPAFN